MRLRPRVLIPSDNFDWVANFAGGYREMGFDVAAGQLNFELESGEYDIVHLLWPEEFTGWGMPSAAGIDAVLRRLDRWRGRARLIMSVSQLYPHRYPKDPLFHRLYSGFFERAEVIHHFSKASKELVCREYPAIAGGNHVVRVGFNYERLLPRGPRDRTAARRAFGFSPDEMAFLVFGSLRFWEEVRVLQRALALARLPNKKLLLAAHYVEGGPVWRQRWRRWQWRCWQMLQGMRTIYDRVPDEELPRMFDAVDAVIVVRQSGMTSGLPSMAMTFGRFVIAPNLAGTAEYLEGTGNILYEPTSAEELARALERAVAADRECIGAENARMAAAWGWAGIVEACLNALPPAQYEMGARIRESAAASGARN